MKNRGRRILSTFLLAVYLTAMLGAVLHRHEAPHITQPECAECVHHLPHTGHIGTYNASVADCVLCHFLGLPYVYALIAVILAPVQIIKTLCSPQRSSLPASYYGILNSRAPPFFFC